LSIPYAGTVLKGLSLRHQSYAWMLVNTVVWGAAFVLSKGAFDITTPFRFLMYRFFIAAIIMLPVLWRHRNQPWAKPKSVLKIIGLELIGTTFTLIFFWGGLTLTSAIEASLIATTAPLFVVLLGVWRLKEKQERVEWMGFGFAMIGTLLIVALPILGSKSLLLAGALIGNLSIIVANISESVYFVLAKKQYRQIPKLFVAAVGFFVGLISFSVFSLAEAGWNLLRLLSLMTSDLAEPTVYMPVLYMAIFGSVIGLTAYIKGQDGIEASEATFFRYLQPLIYIPLGIWLLGESFYSLQFLALFLIIVGFLLSEQREGKRHSKIRKPLL